MNHTFKNHNEWAFWNLYFCWTMKTFCLPNGEFPHEIRCSPTKLISNPKSSSMYSFYLTLWISTNSSNPDFMSPSLKCLPWSPQAPRYIFSSLFHEIYTPIQSLHQATHIFPQTPSTVVFTALLLPSTHLENSYSFLKTWLKFSFSRKSSLSYI